MNKKNRILSKCPVCSSANFYISEMRCEKCGAVLKAVFTGCEFCQLEKEEYEFIKIFVLSRGSIKEMEKRLQLSYPTVKAKLDKIVQKLEGLFVKTLTQSKEELIKDKLKKLVKEGKLNKEDIKDYL